MNNKDPRGSSYGNRVVLNLTGFVLAAVLWAIDTGVVEAVPAFARKYDMTCNVCHTRQPRLNAFGQRFAENGYQLPGTEDGGVTLKQMLGGELNAVTLDDVSNFFAVRLRADIQKASFDETTAAMEEQNTSDDVDIVFPRTINLFFAGTATENMSFFFEAEYDTQDEAEKFLRFERSFIAFDNIGGHQMANFKIGQFDPSSFFSFPTHRQQINPIKLSGETDKFPPSIGRIPLLPLAFASKMFGLTTGPDTGGTGSTGSFNPGGSGAVDTYDGNGDDGLSILPFEPYLFNAPVQKGATIYGRPFGTSFLYQIGVAQNDTADNEQDTRWDTYAMLRFDHMWGDYTAFQISGFYYNAPDAARAALAPPPRNGDIVFSKDTLDWKRYGIGTRLQYKYLDIYATAIWDEIDDPEFGNNVVDTSEWETDAFGASVEVDWLLTQKWMLGARYDYMETGGLEKLPVPFRAPGDKDINSDASFLALIAKYYMSPNIGLYGRAHFNLESTENLPNALGGETSPATNLESIYTIGIDMAF